MGTSTSSNADALDGASPGSRRTSGNGNRSSQQGQASPAAAAADAAAAGNNGVTPSEALANLSRPYTISERARTQPAFSDSQFQTTVAPVDDSAQNRGRERQRETVEVPTPVRCINPASEVNARLDTQVEVRVYPCNNNQSGGKKKFTTFTIKPEVSFIGLFNLLLLVSVLSQVLRFSRELA